MDFINKTSYFYHNVINKPIYEEIDSLPFMKTPMPTIIVVVAYIAFVLKIGPLYMKNKSPYSLKKTLIIYNALQVAFSIYLFQRYTRYILKFGLLYSKCYMDDYETRQEVLQCIWFYYISKATELVDTIFFVLRKKYNQTTYLHIHHHTSMFSGCWAFLKYTPSDTVAFIGSCNAFVHIIMYTYYGLSAMGPHMAKYLTWKKHLTTLQLLQFVIALIVFLVHISISTCPPSKIITTLIIMNDFLFLYMFGKFFYLNYMKSDDAKAVKKKSK